MKSLSIFFVAMCLIICCNAQPVKKNGQLKVQGSQLVNQAGQPLVLNGVSFGWSCFHPRFYTAGTVNCLVKDWSCNVVRAALGVEPNGGYLKDSATSVKLIKTVVDAAIREGVYVIIDWHSHNINMPQAKHFFQEMAKAYGKYPNVIYELFNEPDYETWPQIKAYSIELIAAIRAIDPDNIILVGSPKWDQDINLPAADPIKEYDNLMYTVHFYAGTHKQWLRDRTDAAIAAGLPIFISESAGMEASGDGPINQAEWQQYIDWMEAKKISWVTWSVSDKNETCSMLNTTAASNGDWIIEDLKESGVKTREYLRKKNRGKK